MRRARAPFLPRLSEEVSPIPFKSDKQRRYMHANEPEVAKRWEKEAKAKGKSPVQKKKRGS